MNTTEIIGETERSEGELPRCETCGGTLLVFATDYVTFSRCIACGRSNVIGWVSCQFGMLRGPAGTSVTWGAAG